MHAIFSGEPLHLRSDGTFTRDYIYVSDVVSAYLFLQDRVGETKGEVFNIAGDTTTTVLHLITQVEEICHVKIPYVIDNTQKNEIPHQHLNWEKIKTSGWKPSYTLENGLKLTYEWYRKIYETF